MSEEISEIELHPDFADGLLKIEQNAHLIVLYWAHLAKRDILKTIPPAAKELHGVFASRSPGRPNPLSLCIVELIERSGEGTGCPLGQCRHRHQALYADGCYIVIIKIIYGKRPVFYETGRLFLI